MNELLPLEQNKSLKSLLLIDANALIHRAFHALPPLTSSQGEVVNALYGLAAILIKILREQKPIYVAAAFDRPEETFRKKILKSYKANRPVAAESLVSQIIKAHELFEKFNIKTFEAAGFEADDIIASLVKKFKKEPDLKIIILTGDLDTLQLVENDKVIVQFLKKGVSETFIYNEKAVEERFGLKPSALNDYKALVGDPSDNIKGVKGIGPKTALKLIKQYKNLENLFAKINPQESLGQKILSQKDKAFLAKKLSILFDNVPLEINLSDLLWPGLSMPPLIKYFGLLGFQSLIKRIIDKPLAPLSSSFKKPKEETLTQETKKSNQKIIIIPDSEKAFNLKHLLQQKVLKVAFDWAHLLKELKQKQIEVKEPIFDLKIAAWLIDSSQKNNDLHLLSKRFLQKDFLENEKDLIIKELYYFFDQKLKNYGLTYIFQKIEMPLVWVLFQMENEGIKINKTKLKALEQKLKKETKLLALKIYQEAGVVFNINSAKQLSQLLYEKLNIQFPKSKKTASGFFSTAEVILNPLRNEYHLVDLILKYREATKIKNTYVEPILKRLDKNNRLHSHFLQTNTSTGRLSSEKPNLQNIPQESEWAKALRQTFEPKKGWRFVSFDYAQLELRLLAELTGDEKLKEAFLKNQDIHQITASRILHLKPEQITPSLRRLGKIFNFGIIYGMGPYSLATTAGITEAEARKFIEEYFLEFPKIKIWQEKVKAEARTFGYVKNLLGRRRWFLDIISLHPRLQAEVERAAINMPIQSLGADILKMSMVKIFQAIQRKKWSQKVTMILSLHDELLFEIKNDMLKEAIPFIKETMEKIFPLSVALKVEVKQGKNWGEMFSINEKESKNF